MTIHTTKLFGSILVAAFMLSGCDSGSTNPTSASSTATATTATPSQAPAPAVTTPPVVTPPPASTPAPAPTPTPAPPASSGISLGANLNPFAVLAGSTITCTTSTVTGDVGVSPGSAVTGFPGLCTANGAIRSTAESVAAQADLASMYATLGGQACASISAVLDGLTLTPGVYCVGAATSNLTGTLTLNGSGTYVFELPSTLITSSGAQIRLTNGASCGGVHWQVGSSATIAGTFVGNVIAFSSITMNPGANLSGRALARGGAVTLTTNVVSNASCN